MRGIFPNVVAISSDGTYEIPEDEVRASFEEIIAERRTQPPSHTVDVRRAGGES
jgi:hypothetical protein